MVNEENNKEENKTIEILVSRCNKCYFLHKLQIPLSIISSVVISCGLYMHNHSLAISVLVSLLSIPSFIRVFTKIYQLGGVKTEDKVESHPHIQNLLLAGWFVINK